MSNPAEAPSSADTPALGALVPDRLETPPASHIAADSGRQATESLSADGTPASVDNEGLPEWEPLTPELVEEEAIRGDFVLRGAALLLALLLGWTVVDRSEALVQIRSGQYLAAHGFLPPRTDVFSASAEGRRWVNLSWLWDLLVGVIDRVTGPAGLTILSALLSLAIFWLVVQSSIPGVSTWWGSVCAVLAAVACFPSLTATPQIVTLLGVALTMRLLLRWQWDPTRPLWPLVGVLLVWGNLDPRAWIGGVVLTLFAVGTWLDGFRRRAEQGSRPSVAALVVTAVCGSAVLLVHPFLWETWLSPLRLYSIDYPTWRVYLSTDVPFGFETYSAAQQQFWAHLNLFSGAALLLMVIAGVTLLLNRPRLRLSSVFVLAGVNVIGIAGGRELAVASIVNAILATINAQEWYQATFRQTYSLDKWEMLFSRAGRALTVAVMFGLGYAAVTGHLMGADGRRVGMGLSADLSAQIASYEALLADAFDDRSFNSRLEQGDILIWLGRKPFIDSRVRLYGSDAALVPEHLAVRQSLRTSSDRRANQANADQWTRILDQYHLYQVLPRMSGTGPDYLTYYSLVRSPDWQLTGQEAASASFYRTKSGNPELAAYLQSHDATQFVSQFLRADSNAEGAEKGKGEGEGNTASRGLWPRPPTFYDRYVYLKERVVPNAISIAAHYNFLREMSRESQRRDEAVALAYAAIRSAREGLREHPHLAGGYRLLGAAYDYLSEVESSIQRNRGLGHALVDRFYQIVASYHQVLDCAPNDVLAMYRLYEVYDSRSRHDLALKYLLQVESELGSTSVLPITHPDQFEQEQANNSRKAELQQQVADVREQVDRAVEAPEGRLSAAELAYAAGCPLLALEVLEADLTVAASNPLARMLLAILLLEVGRTAEAHDQLESLRNTPVADQVPEWAIMDAYANLAADELLVAANTLEERHDALEDVMAEALLGSLPLRFIGPAATADGRLDWGDGDVMAPLLQAQSISLLGTAFYPRLEQIDVLRALIAIEMGEMTTAARWFEDVLARNPNSALRPLIEEYVRLISNRQLTQPRPVEPHFEPDLFADGKPTSVPKSADRAGQQGGGVPVETDAAASPVQGASPPSE